MTGADALPYRPCVGLVLANDAGRVWTGLRIDRPDASAEAWQMPQGGIDPGESVDEAGLRELREETGLSADKVKIAARTAEPLIYDLPPELLGRVWGGKWRGQIMDWLLLRFRGADSDISIDTDHPEFSAWKWQDPERLVAEIVPFKRDVYRAVLAEFGDKL